MKINPFVWQFLFYEHCFAELNFDYTSSSDKEPVEVVKEYERLYNAKRWHRHRPSTPRRSREASLNKNTNTTTTSTQPATPTKNSNRCSNIELEITNKEQGLDCNKKYSSPIHADTECHGFRKWHGRRFWNPQTQKI